jgi:hypothetical protein
MILRSGNMYQRVGPTIHIFPQKKPNYKRKIMRLADPEEVGVTDGCVILEKIAKKHHIWG